MSKTRFERARDGFALIFFVLTSLWLTWPLLPRLAIGLDANPDTLLNVWALGWNFHILPREPLSLFDANIFFPRPDTLAYSEHLFGIALVFWPVRLVTGNLVLTYNLAVFSTFVLSGFGMYLLVRDLTGDRWAGLAAGVVYSAAPYRFLHIVHVQLLSYQWFPFIFWCLFRFLRHSRRSSLLGVVVFSLLQVLSSNYYAVYLALTMLVFGLVLLLLGRELLDGRKLMLLTAGAASVLTLSLPFFLPYQRNRSEQGFYRRYEDLVQFSALPGDYLRPSSFNKAPHLSWLPPQQRSEKALFPGFLMLALGLAGTVVGLRSPPKGPLGRWPWIFFLLLGVIGLLLSLGPEIRLGGTSVTLPYRWLYRYLPGFNGMRVPARASMLFLLSGAVLAGLGLREIRRRVRPFGSFIGIGLLGLLLFEYQTYSLRRVLPQAPEIPAVYHWLSSQRDEGAVLILPIHEGDAITEESRYMYDSTIHWRPLVNGFSGWWPNDYWELVGRLRFFPTARHLRFLLERAPVRFIIIHYDRIPEPRRRQLREGMDRYYQRMPMRARFGADVVYEVVE